MQLANTAPTQVDRSKKNQVYLSTRRSRIIPQLHSRFFDVMNVKNYLLMFHFKMDNFIPPILLTREISFAEVKTKS